MVDFYIGFGMQCNCSFLIQSIDTDMWFDYSRWPMLRVLHWVNKTAKCGT